MFNVYIHIYIHAHIYIYIIVRGIPNSNVLKMNDLQAKAL